MWRDKGAEYRPDKCTHPVNGGCEWCCVYCNYDRHLCPGCGAITDHNTIICQDCEKI